MKKINQKKKMELEDLVAEIRKIDTKIDNLDSKFDTKIDNLDSKFDLKIKNLNTEITSRISKEIENLAVMVHKGFEEQGRKLEELCEFGDRTEQNFFEVKSNIKTIFSKLDSIDGTLAKINPMLYVLKYNDKDLEKRVTKIEHKLGMA